MTYKLNGQIIRRQVWGELKAVPAEVGGAKLQAKTVFPSHSEQTISPDDDYDGLAVVTVKPVPRLPACTASLSAGVRRVVEKVVNIVAAVEVTGKVFVQTHALYNGIRRPLLPEDVLTNYPYCWIKDNIAYFSTGIWYLSHNLSKGDVMTRTVSETAPRYKYNADTDAWELYDNSSSNFIVGSYYSGSIQWTNFNVPEGSSSATSYFKTATTPGLTV